MERIITDGLP